MQSARDRACHHSPEPFDCAFRAIVERRDLSPAAKLAHAHLVTLHRTAHDATQTEIGAAIGMSRHQVWRAVAELVAAGLVQTIRYGLGRPNGYVLLGIDQASLDGSGGGRASGRRPDRPRSPASREPSRAGTSYPPRTTGRTGAYPVARTSADLMQTRYGPIRREAGAGGGAHPTS